MDSRNNTVNILIILVLAFMFGFQIGLHDHTSSTGLALDLGNWHVAIDTAERSEARHSSEIGRAMTDPSNVRQPGIQPGSLMPMKPVSSVPPLPPPLPKPPPPSPPSPPSLPLPLPPQQPPPKKTQPPPPPQVNPPAPAGPSTMRGYLEGGRKLTIIVLACNRPEYLTHTLNSLLSGVRGARAEDILVVQDGKHAETQKVIEDFGLNFVQNTGGTNLRRGAVTDGAARIATHYKYALGQGFDHNKDSPGVIIIEDDFLFSPDFLEYFENNGPVLEEDPTTFIMSAWNDNGLAVHVKDKSKLLRTDYFPGLGWMMPRKVWNELGPMWPNTHWDHWMRDPRRHKGRSCVHPEVPRSYHIGGEAERGADSVSIRNENHTRLYSRKRRTPSPTTIIILTDHPNPFRDSLRSLQSRARSWMISITRRTSQT